MKQEKPVRLAYIPRLKAEVLRSVVINQRKRIDSLETLIESK